MTILQFFIILFVFFALVRTFRQFRKGKFTLAMLFAWMVFWLVVALVVILPQTTEILARFVGVGRGVDAIMYVSILALFYIVFRLLVKIEDVEREITRLVRKLGVEEAERKQK